MNILKLGATKITQIIFLQNGVQVLDCNEGDTAQIFIEEQICN